MPKRRYEHREPTYEWSQIRPRRKKKQLVFLQMPLLYERDEQNSR